MVMKQVALTLSRSLSSEHLLMRTASLALRDCRAAGSENPLGLHAHRAALLALQALRLMTLVRPSRC